MRLWWSVLCRVALVIVAVLAVSVTVVAVLRPGADDPADAFAPAGTPLPDGFTVPEGAQLIGTPLRFDPVSDEASSGSWTAVLSVTGDPIETWSAMLAELFDVLIVPNDPSDALGCGTYDGRFECVISRYRPEPAPPLQVGLDMRPVPGDVSGRYSLVISAVRTEQPYDYGSDPWPGGSAPAPPPARARPGVGEPLAPETVAYDVDTERYVLLEGTELLVQFSPGSNTGGFGVLLRVTPGADVQDIAAAYAEQARQFDDGLTHERVTTNADSTVYGFIPPGGAGGYQGEVYGLDADSGEDYIYYYLSYD